jgi:hypothetical protein
MTLRAFDVEGDEIFPVGPVPPFTDCNDQLAWDNLDWGGHWGRQERWANLDAYNRVIAFAEATYRRRIVLHRRHIVDASLASSLIASSLQRRCIIAASS